jgi:hypothetical protein
VFGELVALGETHRPKAAGSQWSFGEGDFAKFLSEREGEENTKQSWEGEERYTISPEQ